MEEKFFNAHHAPIGAFASLTLGYKGASGGLGLELDRPANENVYIGIEEEDQTFQLLPFFSEIEDERKRYDLDAEERPEGGVTLKAFSDEAVERHYSLTEDTWKAGDLTFTICSPFFPVPDPETSDEESLKKAIVPAVLAEMTIDNRKGNKKRQAFFGYEGRDPYRGMRHISWDHGRIKGIGQGARTAIMTDGENVHTAIGFHLEHILSTPYRENWSQGLGDHALLLFEVPPGEKVTYRFAICFYHGGPATSGLTTTYYYTRFFQQIEDVGAYALRAFPELRSKWQEHADPIVHSPLTPTQRKLLFHAIRSYYGNTQLLEHQGRPLWVVNEGEYRMMNTFDLTVDQLFFEVKMHPWTVRNELEWFIRRYSYTDNARLPDDETLYPGGISFTHDMGVAGVFSQPGHSSYEQYGLSGCFSHMTHEQLVNFVLTAAVYCEQSGDEKWRRKNKDIFVQCLHSLMCRDHPNPEKRDGIMSLDSSRTMGGAEITTYDSLDTSLGQARNNLYLAVKTWAAYLYLEKMFQEADEKKWAKAAGDQAEKCARTIQSSADEEGNLPAVFGENEEARIIPAIEGLVFPYYTNCRTALAENGKYQTLLETLKKHLRNVLTEGVCLFKDGGWKLSSTSDNSWLSKIFLCQFVAREILGVIQPPEDAERADQAHASWLFSGTNGYWCFSDQIVAGSARASKYYPRGVTAILWLDEKSPEEGRAL